MKRNKNIKIKKQGFWDFTPRMIMLGFILLGLVGIFLSNSKVSDKYINEFEKDAIALGIFFNGIFYEDGYINSVEQPWCSDAQTTTDVTVHRVVKCSDFRNIYYQAAGVGDEADPLKSYLKVLTRFNTGCKIYVSDVAGISNQMYVYVECDLGLSKVPPEQIEGDFIHWFKENYPDEYIGEDRESIGLSTNTGGTWEDGKVRMTFEK